MVHRHNVPVGTKSGTKPMSRADPQQQGLLGTKMEQKWPLSWGFALSMALRTARFGARFQTCNTDMQVFDLRFYGDPREFES